jgi:hypothetical protein
MNSSTVPATVFRIWLVRPARAWRPSGWDDLPESAVAVALADSSALSAEAARAFLAGHNQALLADSQSLWAVAVPVQIAYTGDLRPGDVLRGDKLQLP